MNSIAYEVISKRIPRQVGVKVRKEGKYYVALSPIIGTFISLNQLAGVIYNMLDGNRNIESIVDELSNRFTNVEKEKIKEDVCKCISDLEAYHLVTVIR